MNLRVVALMLAFFLPGYTSACVVPNIIEDGSVTITQDKDSVPSNYQVEVPEEYNGAPIEYLILTASKGSDEITVPLFISSKDGATGSRFRMSSQWVNIRVSAHYQGLQCTELVSTLSMQ